MTNLVTFYGITNSRKLIYLLLTQSNDTSLTFRALDACPFLCNNLTVGSTAQLAVNVLNAV